MRKTILDDGFHSYLVKNTEMVGDPGIPMMLNLHNTTVPKDIIPYEKCKREPDKRKYIHFYMHDMYFSTILTATDKYVDLLKQFDGVITPDCSLLIGQSACLQQTNTYFNRAVGVFLQHQGMAVIPNIRWSDESSFKYCFLGVPKHVILSVSTHGCIHTMAEKFMFRLGLEAMISELEPRDVLVHGHMPDEIFADFFGKTRFHRYPSQFEKTHLRKGS